MTRPRSRRLPAAVLGAAALGTCALGACGIPADSEPRAITEEQIPDTTTTTPDVGDEGQTRSVELYFTRFDGNRDVLTTVEHEVPTGGESGRPTPATVLEALLSGVPDDAADPAVVTKIPADTSLASQPELNGGILTVDLDNGISGVQGDGARLAFGQMVCTVDLLDGVEGVVFEIEGDPVYPLVGDGETSSAPLTCASYDNLLGD
ncbi:MAG TPA: GerMN domain-containing protein [Acidimicrobiales bacterium]|nr:GerMN domain-containing protein [Acidimicrobiales bacterium]